MFIDIVLNASPSELVQIGVHPWLSANWMLNAPDQFVPLENFPEHLTKTRCILGIDEAGRGPVLGPLVYSIFICPLDHEHVLKELGVADSKVLEASSREAFAKEIATNYIDKMGWSVKVVTPQYISHSMLKHVKHNLNSLSYETVYFILDKIAKAGVNVHHVYVDTLGKPETYKKQLSERFPRFQFTVTSKADSLFPVVGAASIFAKVTRDFNLENWKPATTQCLDFDRDFGSGYPSDPNTVNWLKRNLDTIFGFPEIVRFSWSSCARILEEMAVPVHWNDPVDEDSKPSTKSKKRHINPQQISPPKKESHNFMTLFHSKQLTLGNF